MERVMTAEEKIRRAEEIYQRRKQGNSKQIATVSVTDKKDIKLLKKMIIQIIICALIYGTFYIIENNNYVFSEDVINKTKELLSYDINFSDIYNNLKTQYENLVNQNQETSENDAIGGAEEIEEINPVQEETVQEENTTSELTQEEQEVLTIKNIATFIKPIEGTITSRFGQRETATGSVPKNHTGTDIAADLGTKIKSATDGEVVLSSEEGDYGKHLKIQIGEVSVIYAHCNNLYVSQGEKVVQGQEIAEVGSTGNSTRTSSSF